MISSIHLNMEASERVFNRRTIDTLRQQGFTQGLITSLASNKRSFPASFWIIDNSGSMSTNDGKKIASTNKNDLKVVPVSRWGELRQTVEYHARLAASLHAPTIFRLLNDPGIVAGPQQFSVACKQPEDIDHELNHALEIIGDTSPSGATPLTRHLREVRNNVLLLTDELQATGTRVAIIIATDGLPSDSDGNSTQDVMDEFEDEIRSFKHLPVWIVVRLCTDEARIVQYWNLIDKGKHVIVWRL
jgi:hypothetical protein